MITATKAKEEFNKMTESYIKDLEYYIDFRIRTNFDYLQKGQSVFIKRVEPRYRNDIQELTKKYEDFSFYMDAYEEDLCNFSVKLRSKDEINSKRTRV